ncbi:MAG TPA: CHAD domain-containing protein [Solirubrobacteraceae bacterium]|nr:CHAD domain-containing protein [Solirubrobacteraceae bacterium]
MTTDWTAIRRRLAIRGRAHRPPWGGRKPAGHRSILAPIAATFAATFAVTAGVALANAERKRRSARQRRRDRRLGLNPGEHLADALPRMALGQVDLMLELLAHEDPADAATTVHEVRKALKRLRALLRLLEHQLGGPELARESQALRNTAQRLSGARDAEVMLATLNALIARHPRKLARRPAVRQLRKRLLAEQARVEHITLGEPIARAVLMAELQRFRRQVLAWQLAHRPGIALVESDLIRLYTQGRKRHLRILRSKGNQTIPLHQWRKRVKDLRYAAEILQRRDTAKRSHAQQRLRQLARRADTLSELLGQDHDLALLAQNLHTADKRPHSRDGRPEGPRTWRMKPKTRKLLLKAIAKRRRELQKRALRDGARLYRHSPRKFLSRIS